MKLHHGIGVGLAALALAALAAATLPRAQEAGQTMPETQAPAAQTPTRSQPASGGQPAAPEALTSPSGHPDTAYWQEHDRKLVMDFGNLEHFKSANAAVQPPVAGENRVVFMGDSITEGWKIEGPESMFPGKPYFNRGISGQTTPQMLVRFRQDAIELQPKVVVILGGTNDIAGNTGPMTLKQTEDDLASMADLAAANRIRVVLCSVTPAIDFWWAPGQKPALRIADLNAWIKAYAAEKGYVYVDFYSAMKDPDGGLPPSLSRDGVHPNPAGYAVMAPLVEAGIAAAEKQGPKTKGQGLGI